MEILKKKNQLLYAFCDVIIGMCVKMRAPGRVPLKKKK